LAWNWMRGFRIWMRGFGSWMREARLYKPINFL
jgi:hypothetical protein